MRSVDRCGEDAAWTEPPRPLTKTAASARSWVPIVGWLRSYRRADLRYDVIAGVTVSALVVPKALGYAEIARVLVESGLYAAAAGALLYAVFGTSRQISTGPSSAARRDPWPAPSCCPVSRVGRRRPSSSPRSPSRPGSCSWSRTVLRMGSCPACCREHTRN